ncbi:HNH endonuclease [Sesbania bispinosa]|nr:HNH endonuclease [Sesbania bispinosa]
MEAQQRSTHNVIGPKEHSLAATSALLQEVTSGPTLGGEQYCVDDVGAGPMCEQLIQLACSLGEDVLDQATHACEADPGVAAQQEMIGLVKVYGPQLEACAASRALSQEDPLGLLLGDHCASVDDVGAIQIC